MCDDLDIDLDAHGVDEMTPLPRLGPAMSPLQADYDVALATCNQLRRANAALQARCDEPPSRSAPPERTTRTRRGAQESEGNQMIALWVHLKALIVANQVGVAALAAWGAA
jgi:hypothetical protein